MIPNSHLGTSQTHNRKLSFSEKSFIPCRLLMGLLEVPSWGALVRASTRVDEMHR